jgi:hypothetical protein
MMTLFSGSTKESDKNFWQCAATESIVVSSKPAIEKASKGAEIRTLQGRGLRRNSAILISQLLVLR